MEGKLKGKDAEKQDQETTMNRLSETRDPESLELELSPWARDPEELELELRPWADLPPEILEPISSRLILSDCFRFPSVCKNWQAIKIPRRLRTEPPWFVALSKTDGICTLFDTSCNRTYRINSPDLDGASIHSSRFGWLLLSKLDGIFTIFSFFNPITLKTMELPPSRAVNFNAASFSAPPTSSECLVIVVQTSSRSSTISVHLYNRAGDQAFSWYQCRVLSFRNFLIHPHTPVFNNGLVYFAGYGGKVGVFNLNNTFWSVIENPMAGIFDYTVNFVAELDSEVLLVSVPAPNRPIQVLRVDAAAMTMTEVTDLGERALFVSPKAAMMTRVEIKGMRNKIHHPVIGANRLCERVGSFSMDKLEYERGLETSLPMEVTKFLIAGGNSWSWAWIDPEASLE